MESETALAAAEEKADFVALHFGLRAPAPLAGETALAYRRRLLRPFQRHSRMRLSSLGRRRPPPSRIIEPSDDTVAVTIGGVRSALNLIAPTVIKASPGRLGRLVVINRGCGGMFTFNDAATRLATAIPLHQGDHGYSSE